MSEISLIIPVYNAEDYLEKCLHSVKSQSFCDFEVIMINDGSIDRSRDIMEKYSSIDSRFISVEKKNGGVSSARNLGLEHSTGKWIAFADADDWLEPDYFKIMIDEITDNDLDVIMCRRIDETNKGANLQIVSQKEHLKIVSFTEFIPNEEDFYGTCWGFLFKKSIIDNIRFDETISFAEDALFSLTVMSKSDRIGILNEFLYHYNMKDHVSLSQGKADKKKITIIRAREEQAKLLTNKTSRKLMLGRLADSCYYLFLLGMNDADFMEKFYYIINTKFRHNFIYWNSFRGGNVIKKVFRLVYFIDLRFGYKVSHILHKNY